MGTGTNDLHPAAANRSRFATSCLDLRFRAMEARRGGGHFPSPLRAPGFVFAHSYQFCFPILHHSHFCLPSVRRVTSRRTLLVSFWLSLDHYHPPTITIVIIIIIIIIIVIIANHHHNRSQSLSVFSPHSSRCRTEVPIACEFG